MKIRVAALALALLGLPSVAASTPFSDAASALDGVWRGNDFVLRVDARRAQASIDPAHPFAWERFLIKEVTPDEIVFTVGPELYEAEIADDTLTLKGTSFRGARVLFRDKNEDLRGSLAQ